jgi:glycosyltransferase involved in cell wall biosynthesis
MKKPRIAIIHEWLIVLAGSEKVLEQICILYPDADLFCVVADPATIAATPYLARRQITTTCIQKMPFGVRRYKTYLPLMPLAVEQLDLSAYDLVISSSHAVAKGVLTGPDQLHICYTHSPIRYAWDLQHQYLRESGLNSGLKAWIARWLLHKIRLWDYRTAAGVDHFVANSHFIRRRISKVYGRVADVIYPPVDVESFSQCDDKEQFYLAASRLVPYKRIDAIVEAFVAMPSRHLVVIGDGPDMGKLRALANGHTNIEILGYQPFEVLKDHMQRAKAFIFAAEEDFGIIPVEAQACGTPVIAYGKGGSLETVRGGVTGVFFAEQSASAIQAAVDHFEGSAGGSPTDCRAHAERFSIRRFRDEFSSYVDLRWQEFSDGNTCS